ncbi:unnamed protein product, partial [Polarella glacialis]
MQSAPSSAPAWVRSRTSLPRHTGRTPTASKAPLGSRTQRRRLCTPGYRKGEAEGRVQDRLPAAIRTGAVDEFCYFFKRDTGVQITV